MVPRYQKSASLSPVSTVLLEALVEELVAKKTNGLEQQWRRQVKEWG